MIYAVLAVSVVAVVTAAAVLAGRKLPEVHRFEVTRVYSLPPDELWPRLLPLDRPEWKDMTVTHEAQTPEKELALQLVDDKGPFRGTWVLTLEPLGGGTQLTVRETGTISNPIARVLARYALGEDALAKAFLDGLSREITGA